MPDAVLITLIRSTGNEMPEPVTRWNGEPGGKELQDGGTMNKFSELADKYGIQYGNGDCVFSQGDTGDAMYLVYSGEVEITREDGGSGTFLNQLGPGEIFGEMALIDNKPRSATATATAETVLIPLNAQFLKGNIRKDTSFIFQIVETLIIRLEQTGEMLADLSGNLQPEVRQEEPEVNTLPFLAMFKGFADPDRFIEFMAGEMILEEGEAGDVMFVILEGEVGITVESHGSTRTLAVMGRGDFFGESALLTDMPRAASAVARADSVLIPFVRKDLIVGLMENPEAALQFVQILILRLRRNLSLLSG
jgi:CRP-like cAMP-binding protein